MKTLAREEQRHRVLKARVAVALYSEHGKVPKEEEVENMYRVVDALYKTSAGRPLHTETANQRRAVGAALKETWHRRKHALPHYCH